DDDDEAHVLRLGLLGEVGAEVATEDRAGDHDDRLRPVHGMRKHEQYGCYAVRHRRKPGLQRVHGVDVLHAEQGQHGEDEDPGAGAEIPDVEGDEKLKNYAAPGSKLAVLAMRRALPDPAADAAAHHEDDGRDEKQPWHQA